MTTETTSVAPAAGTGAPGAEPHTAPGAPPLAAVKETKKTAASDKMVKGIDALAKVADKTGKAKVLDMTPAGRATALAAAVRVKMKDVESIQIYGSKDDLPKIKAISTGSLGLDQALGIGGLPEGRIIEIYGPESSGKTTLAIQSAVAAQHAGGVASFVDAEHALDLNYARALGMDTDSLLLSQPSCGEEALDIAEILVINGKRGDIVVIDSVAALVPRAEIDGAMGDSHMGLAARLMGQALRKITGPAHENGVTVIFINQLRMKLGVMFGNPETTTGGNALKFYASVRIDVRRVGGNKDANDVVVSNQTRAKVIKNKVSPPFREALFDIRFGQGVDYRSEVIDIGSTLGIIGKSGSWYSYKGENFANGKEAAIQTLVNNAELDQELYRAVRSAMFPTKK